MELKFTTPNSASLDAGLRREAEAILPEQVVYATLLDHSMKIGMAVLAASFLLYVSGVVSPHVPLEQLPNYWTMPAADYLRAAGLGNGWSWLGLVHKGDFLNFVGIAFLSAVTIVCYLRILPYPVRAGDRLFAAVLLAEVAVLLLSASGILAAGH